MNIEYSVIWLRNKLFKDKKIQSGNYIKSDDEKG